LNQTSRAFYHLRVRNNGKTPAYSCRIMMRFVNRINGEPLFTVNGKWDRGPQPLLYAPVPRRILPDGTVETAIGEFPHDFLIPFAEVLDIHPKIPETFCILLKYENEDECYAFSSWSYLRGRGHRVDEWRLNAGEYIAEIELSYSGRRILEKFLLRNHSRNADGAEISKWYNERKELSNKKRKI